MTPEDMQREILECVRKGEYPALVEAYIIRQDERIKRLEVEKAASEGFMKRQAERIFQMEMKGCNV